MASAGFSEFRFWGVVFRRATFFLAGAFADFFAAADFRRFVADAFFGLFRAAADILFTDVVTFM
jgi:hypothetical protein